MNHRTEAAVMADEPTRFSPSPCAESRSLLRVAVWPPAPGRGVRTARPKKKGRLK